MKIKENSFVAIEYTLKIDSGEEIDKSEEGNPLSFVFSAGQVIPGLEEQLSDKEVGWSSDFSVESKDGYGQPNPELIQKVPRTNFPEDAELKPGMAFEAQTQQGMLTFTVREIGKEEVTIDMNHPLCGERLHFSVKVIEVRDATAEELASLEEEEEEEGCDCSESSCEGCGQH